MKNLKSYSDHNIEEAKNKILKAIESCTNHRQIETIYSMIDNFEKLHKGEDISEINKSLNKKIEELDVD
jgi:hypothetical protein